ncbi:hypothetical protein J7M28_03910 [bacterium]|nr:hypothetical protein [bacterium]
MALHIIGIVVGLIGLFWGVWASQIKKFPLNLVGGIVSIACLLLAIVSVVLLCVPEFFG